MPILDFNVDDPHKHVIDPVAEQIIRSILMQLGAYETFKDELAILSDYSAIVKHRDKNNNVKTPGNRCEVKVDAAILPTDMRFDTMGYQFRQDWGVAQNYWNTQIPLLSDSSMQVYLYEHYLPCSLSMEFSLLYKNLDEAAKAFNALTATNFAGRVNYHTITFTYPLGMSVMVALLQFYKMNASNINLSFVDWLRKHSEDAIGCLTSTDNVDMQVIVQKRVLRALGTLDMSLQRPEPQMVGQSTDRFAVNFSYYFQFARPDTMSLKFPIVINNQLIPFEFVQHVDAHSVDNVVSTIRDIPIYGYTRHLISENIQQIVRTPTYDDWVVPRSKHPLNDYQTLFIGSLLLDGEITSWKLTDFDIEIHPITLEIIKAHGNDIFLETGLYGIAVYQNDIQVDPTMLSIDDDLTITMTMSDLTAIYHVVVFEATDFKQLDGKWIRTIIKHRTFFPNTIIRNMDLLIHKKFYYIDRENAVLNLLARMIHEQVLLSILDALVEQGHCTSQIFYYIHTPEQIADYLCHTKSLLKDATLYDVFVEYCVLNGYIRENRIPTGYIMTRSGYPALPRQGGYNGCNTPYRILAVDIAVTR